MSARDIVGGLAGAAVGAVKHPVGTAKGVVSAGTSVGTAVAGSVVGRVRGGAGGAKGKAATAKEAAARTADRAAERAKEAAKDPAGAVKESAKDTATKAGDAARTTAAKASQSAKKGAEKAAQKVEQKAPAKKTAKKSAKKTAKKAPAKREPQVVMAEPAPPTEPPIDVVGEALAAEAQETFGAGRATEPRAGSRDEEHGEAALQRAEADEIAEEMAEVARAGNLDLSTPVGTTGADTGFNPDTAEADLQQPGTEPLVDPSLTKEVKSEQDTLHQAADPEKG